MTVKPDDSTDGGTPIEWSAAERAALERLGEATPPEDLEVSVVSALKRQDLVAQAPPGTRSVHPVSEPRVPAHRRWGWAALALAACLAAFYAGISVSDRGAGRTGVDLAESPPSTGAPLGGYLLLLYEDSAYRAPSTPAEAEARVAEYSAWAAGVHADGTPIEGEELAPSAESRTLDGRQGEIVEAPGAPTAAAGILVGYFLIEAPDAAAAVAIARTMPHLEYGGTVVVRPLVPH